MTELKLKAEKRDIFGKSLVEFRKQDMLPAVVYGPKEESQPIFVSLSDFKKVWKEAGESAVVVLEIGGKAKEVLIHEVDSDPLKDEFLHADFYAVDVTKTTVVSVPLEFEGEAPAVKNLGGILVKVIYEVEVEALPKDLPREIKVDISSLENFEDKIIIGDLKVPAGVKIFGNLEEAVVLVEMPKEEAPVVAESSIADIEAISEKKKEEAPTPAEAEPGSRSTEGRAGKEKKE